MELFGLAFIMYFFKLSYGSRIRFLLCVIDIFSKYAWVVPLKDKKGISIVKAFQSILKQSNSKRAKGTSAQHVKSKKYG